MSKKLPALRSDKAAEKLLDKDLSAYISAENLAPFPFEYKPKQESVNLRISSELLDAVRAAARRRGIPYQRFIRQALEMALARKGGRGRAAIEDLKRGVCEPPLRGLKRGKTEAGGDCGTARGARLSSASHGSRIEAIARTAPVTFSRE